MDGGFFVWVVEVLLDEIGVYEYEMMPRGEEGENGCAEEREGGAVLVRRNREQRWGAVVVEEGGGRVVGF